MIKFKTISLKWLTYHQNNVTPQTLDMYRIKTEKLNQYFGNMSIQNIKVIHLQEYINNLYSTNGLSKSTIKKYKITLNLIFKFAIKIGLIEINPIFNVDIPKIINKQTVNGLSNDIISTIIKNKNKNIGGTYAFIMLLTGMRRSELLALKYEDINLNDKYIKVSRKIAYITNEPIITNELKNKDAFRIIEIPILLVNEFHKMNINQKNGFIFKNKTNGVLTKYQNDKMWKQYCHDIVGSKINQHQLRHTYMSILYKADVDIKTAQELLGHKDITTTLNVYTHLDKVYKRKNIEKLDNYIDENFSSNV